MSDIREKILAIEDRPILACEEVPEWGVKIYFRKIPTRDRLAMHQRAKHGMLPLELICTKGCFDADGRRLFSDEDEPLLAEKDPDVLARIAGRILALNRMRPEDVEDAEKKSAPTQSSSS